MLAPLSCTIPIAVLLLLLLKEIVSGVAGAAALSWMMSLMTSVAALPEFDGLNARLMPPVADSVMVDELGDDPSVKVLPYVLSVIVRPEVSVKAMRPRPLI